jgi:hypothetical protein
MAKMQPGIYEARIVNYGIGTTKAGDPQAMILFEYTDQEGQPHEVTWYGTFKEGKGQEITLKALLTCGFKGNDPSALTEGVEGKALDHDRIVKITIKEETSQDGKKFMRIRWINEHNRELKSMDRSAAKVKLGAMNLAGQLAMIRAQNPQPKPAQPTGPAGMREPGQDDDFNFGPA